MDLEIIMFDKKIRKFEKTKTFKKAKKLGKKISGKFKDGKFIAIEKKFSEL